MKYLLQTFLILQFIFIITTFAQQKTLIEKISVNGKTYSRNFDQINPDEKSNIEINLSSEGFQDFEQVNYKVMLNGNVLNLNPENSGKVNLSELQKGEYLFWAQAFAPGGISAEPVTQKFIVSENSNADFVEGLNLQNVLITILIFAGIPAVLFVFIRKLKAKKLQKKNETQTKKNSEDRNQANNIQKNNISNLALSEEFDLQTQYEKIKNEFDLLKEQNINLNSKITELQDYIKELENINVQLINQKEKLQESKRKIEDLHNQKEELFAIAIHDIKNPAAAIKGFVELLESYDLNANEQQEIIQSLVETSSQIVKLTHTISLEIAKAKSEIVVHKEISSLKRIIDTVYKRNFAYAKRKEIKLINQSSASLPDVNIDALKIEEVIDNLVNNAIKYSPKNSVVQLKAFFNDSKIIIEVEDDGVGLSEEDQKKAFKKGTLLTSEPTGDEPRSGLGLWISKKIIEDHDGKVFLKSKLGAGSTFGFEIPIKN